jgi:clan AA aspartic protease
MGVITVPVILANPSRPQLARLTVEALVDTGASHLCVPEAVRRQLQLDEIDRRRVSPRWKHSGAGSADGRERLVPYVGPLTLHVLGRHGVSGALVLGDQVRLGAIAMEDLDLIIEPRRRRVTANPASPDYGRALAKSGDVMK